MRDSDELEGFALPAPALPVLAPSAPLKVVEVVPEAPAPVSGNTAIVIKIMALLDQIK